MKIRIKYLVYILVVILFIMMVPLTMSFKYMYGDSNEISSDEDKDVVELVFSSSWAGTDTKTAGLRKIIEGFQEENKDIRIIDKSICGEEFLFTLKTDFAQGNDPDIFGLWPGSDIRNLVNAGKVADLTEVINEDKQWKNSFGKDAWGYDTIDNKIYGVPCEIIYEGLFLNRDLFQKYNVKVPSTYEELKDAVRIFNENDIIPISYNSTAEGTYIYQNIVSKIGGKKLTETPITNGKFNDCYVKGMYYMRELYNMGAFPKDAFTLDNKGRDDLFINKKAAMIVQGSWFIGDGSLDGNDSTVGIVPFPSFKDGKAENGSMIYGIGNGNFHISEKAFKNPKKKDACVRFLKYLTSSDSAKILNRSAGFISNVKIAEIDKVTTTLNNFGERLIENSKELIGPTDSFVDRNKWEQIMVPNFPKMLEGKIAPEKLLEMVGGAS